MKPYGDLQLAQAQFEVLDTSLQQSIREWQCNDQG
jgi:hypothetical protein